MEQIIIGGIRIARITRAEFAAVMANDCQSALRGELSLPKVVISSNGSVIARYHSDPEFCALIKQADLVDADGASLVIASKIFCRNPLIERVATTDSIHDCCKIAVDHGIRFFFLGGKPGVAQEAASCLQFKHQGLQIVGFRDGYLRRDQESAVCEEIIAAGTNVLWIGMGSPIQEQFAIRNRELLRGLGWIKTCGGLFDHMAGKTPRAPLWMQRYGLEWVHRARQEPIRLGWRYLKTNPVAAYHLLTKTYDTKAL